MKVIILAGGRGTRLAEYTKTIPKPMVKVAGYPLIVHIMKHYLIHGFNKFYIAAGYKSYVIKKYFKNYKKEAKFFNHKILGKSCEIAIINTGLKTLTGGRLKRLEKYFNENENFFFTYGDGISNVNLKKLVKFHKKNKKILTLTAVRPPARFGAIKLKGNKVTYFKEKSKIDEGWINGGFFVMEPKIFKFLKNDKTFLEREPMEEISKKNELVAFKHINFWQCVDTIRDKEILEKILKK